MTDKRAKLNIASCWTKVSARSALTNFKNCVVGINSPKKIKKSGSKSTGKATPERIELVDRYSVLITPLLLYKIVKADEIRDIPINEVENRIIAK